MVVYPGHSEILSLNEIRYNVIVSRGNMCTTILYHAIEQEDTGLGGEREEINSCTKSSSGTK
jgi:hypothetical protein